MVTVHLYIEGGPKGAKENAADMIRWREAFNSFFGKTTLGNTSKPKSIICGGRSQAMDAFVGAMKVADADTRSLLLIDSEGPAPGNVNGLTALACLEKRADDKGKIPKKTDPWRLHLMVETMEAWLLADRDRMKRYYGKAFKEVALPSTTSGQRVEQIAKSVLEKGFKKATKDTDKGEYERKKGSHSPDLLEAIDAKKVVAQCAWAERLVNVIANLKAGVPIKENTNTTYGPAAQKASSGAKASVSKKSTRRKVRPPSNQRTGKGKKHKP